MYDRIPAPGKANRVKITQDDGTVVEGVLSFADDATQEGSAYNKANVLPDDVCSALGINPQTSEPKDAFLAAAPQVGDILTTTRTDLGDNWLLCNGDSVSVSDYPGLSYVMPFNAINEPLNDYGVLSDKGDSFPNYVLYYSEANGNYFAVGYIYDGSNILSIAWTDDPVYGTWYAKTFGSFVSNNRERYVSKVSYANGYYAFSAYCRTEDDTSNTKHIFYTNNLQGDHWESLTITDIDDDDCGAFTSINGYFLYAQLKNDSAVSSSNPYTLYLRYSNNPSSGFQSVIAGSSNSNKDADIPFYFAYGDGYFGILSEGLIAISKDGFTSWKQANITTTFQGIFYFAYYDGKFSVSTHYTGSGSSSYRIYCYNFDAETLDYQTITLSTNNNTGFEYIRYLGDVDNTPVFVLYFGATAASNKYASLVVGLPGEGTTYELNTDVSDCNMYRVYSVSKVGDQYLITGTSDYDQYSTAHACVSNALLGPWNRIQNSTLYGKAIFIDSQSRAQYMHTVTSWQPLQGENCHIWCQDKTLMSLPDISLSDNTYTYIKAE